MSVTIPHTVCVPLVFTVWLDGIDVGLTPLPALPSDNGLSPLDVNKTSTLSLYQPPLPEKSTSRDASADGGKGGLLSTTTAAEVAEYSVVLLFAESTPWTRNTHVPSDWFVNS